MKCRKARLLISLLCDGRINEQQRRELESHLEVCGECKAQADLQEEVSSVLDYLEPLEPVEGGWQRIAAEVENPVLVKRTLVPAYAFALVLLLAVISVMVIYGRRNTQIASVPQPIEKTTAVKEKPIEQTAEHSKPSTGVTEQVVHDQKAIENKQENIVRRDNNIKPSQPERRHRTINKKKSPSAPKQPAPPTETVEIEPTPEQEYLAEAEPTQPVDLSSEADALLARGLSVLVEASAAYESSERGEHL